MSYQEKLNLLELLLSQCYDLKYLNFLNENICILYKKIDCMNSYSEIYDYLNFLSQNYQNDFNLLDQKKEILFSFLGESLSDDLKQFLDNSDNAINKKLKNITTILELENYVNEITKLYEKTKSF